MTGATKNYKRKKSYLSVKSNGGDKRKKISNTQPAFTCSKLTIETLEQGVKYVQS